PHRSCRRDDPGSRLPHGPLPRRALEPLDSALLGGANAPPRPCGTRCYSSRRASWSWGSREPSDAEPTPAPRKPWTWLLRHVFIWRMQCSTYNQIVSGRPPGACHAPVPPMARTRAGGAPKRYPLQRGPGLLPLAIRTRLLAANGLDQLDRASRLRL